ncbi:hypothetical protein CLU97_0055 [Chryseobacterium sp. 7]|nr:hypothetical protein CLU97_0055 [Chryseobacterium sp. 7]
MKNERSKLDQNNPNNHSDLDVITAFEENELKSILDKAKNILKNSFFQMKKFKIYSITRLICLITST